MYPHVRWPVSWSSRSVCYVFEFEASLLPTSFFTPSLSFSLSHVVTSSSHVCSIVPQFWTWNAKRNQTYFHYKTFALGDISHRYICSLILSLWFLCDFLYNIHTHGALNICLFNCSCKIIKSRGALALTGNVLKWDGNFNTHFLLKNSYMCKFSKIRELPI